MAKPITIDQSRLAQITALHHGSHSPNDNAVMCAMEAVAFVAGEPWSDHPQCASPVIGAFMRAWNDSLPDAERSGLLLPLIPRLVGTRGSDALEERRSLMAADWLVREHTPAWLELAGMKDHAAMLRALPEITSMAQVPSIRSPLEAVRKDAAAAGAAAWAAARDAARDAAWAAARAAAWAAARDAAWAAARAAAWAAARDAAWAAARDAARDAAGAAAAAAARDAARDAAWAAARDAARDAAWAAAWAAARDAARDAAWAAARDAAGAAAAAAARDAAWAKLKPTRDALQQSALRLIERMIEAEEPEAADHG
jgi:hypothetical protein